MLDGTLIGDSAPMTEQEILQKRKTAKKYPVVVFCTE